MQLPSPSTRHVPSGVLCHPSYPAPTTFLSVQPTHFLSFWHSKALVSSSPGFCFLWCVSSGAVSDFGLDKFY